MLPRSIPVICIGLFCLLASMPYCSAAVGNQWSELVPLGQLDQDFEFDRPGQGAEVVPVFFMGVGICFWLGFMLLSLAAVAFWIWMIVDCAVNEPPESNDKIVWLLVVILTNWIGALIYFFVRRPERRRRYQR